MLRYPSHFPPLNQQTVVAEEINKNITNISPISEESAIGGEQIARASEELAQL